MSVIDAVLLGILQGLTEFLPISSSGHLTILQSILGIKDTPMLFSVLLHLSTLVAVCLCLKDEVLYILRHPFGRLTRLLVSATAPTVVIALLLKYLFPATFSGEHLGFCFIITSIFLLFSHFLPSFSRKFEDISHRDALVMGIFQGIATLPGISRSSSGILSGALCGLSRDSVARFSFLMSIPAILGALVLDLFTLDPSALSELPVMGVILGCLCAAVVGYGCVKWMMRLISRGRLLSFSIYTATVGVLCIIDKYVTHLVF